MTATVSQFMRLLLTTSGGDALSTALGAVTVILLIGLLIQKEIIRAQAGAKTKVWIDTLNVAIVPLLFAFTVIVMVRFLSVLKLI
jgi:hypothetical protein